MKEEIIHCVRWELIPCDGVQCLQWISIGLAQTQINFELKDKNGSSVYRTVSSVNRLFSKYSSIKKLFSKVRLIKSSVYSSV